MIITNGNVHDLLRAAGTGPFMQAEIVSLTGKGKLRVTCNWLYSSLNCDPNDSSQFLWQFNKLDDQHISLSPVNSCINATIYASVRGDIDYLLQVQAPYSADWITAVGGDETIAFAIHDLSIAQFNGFNGLYVAVNDAPDSHDNHTGYRVRSSGNSFNQPAQWFLTNVSNLQPQIQFSGFDGSLEALKKQVAVCSFSVDDNIYSKLAVQLSHAPKLK